jgi:hypothetical protein
MHLPPRIWLGLGLLGIGLTILGFSIAVVAGALLALFALQLVANVVVARNVGRIRLEPLDHPAVMPGAEDLVQQFSAAGFRAVGAYRFRVAGRPIILTVLIGPERDRIAAVTDKTWQVVSRFGTRSLVTGNSAVAPLPADVLRQQVAGGGPAEIIGAHDAALTLLNRRSRQPDVFATETEVLEAVRQMEMRALAFVGQASLRTALRVETRGASGTRVLGDDPHSLHRLDAWFSSTN